MPSYSLATYTIRVRYKGKRETELLGAFGEQEHDLLTILNGYLAELRIAATIDEESKKLLEVGTINVAGREIAGTIQHGEWGVAAPGKNVRTGMVSYQRGLDDVEPFPFYYLLGIPADSRIGFAILQRNSNVGIRGPLLGYFQARFREQYPAFSINMETAAPHELIEQYIQQGANVKQIRFIQFRLPQNFEDRYDTPGEAVREAYSEFIIHAKRGGLPILGVIREAIRGEGGIARLVEMAPVESNRIKVSMEFGGHTRSLELADTTTMRAYYDITDEVDFGADALPTYDSVDEIARGLLANQYGAIGQ